jgi:hypothetical protein
MRRALIFALLLWLGGIARTSVAAPGNYLQDMPSVAVVLDTFDGFTEVQAAGKSAAALKQLGMIVKELSAGGEFGNVMTAEERAVSERYFNAASEVVHAAAARLAREGAPTSGPRSPGTRVSRAMMYYDQDAFRQRVAQLLLPKSAKLRYANLHPNAVPTGGIALLLGGALLFVVLVKLYFKLFPRRPDDNEVVAYSHTVSVVGGVGVGYSRPVTRRENKLWGRMLMFTLLLAPLFAVGAAVLSLAGPYVDVLEPYLGLADGVFYGAIDLFKCWSM